MRTTFLVLLAVAGSAQAQPAAKEPPPPAGTFLPSRLARVVIGIGSGVGWVRERVSQQQQFSGSGPTFHMTLGLLIKDIFSVSASGGAVFPSDDKSFTEVVMPIGGGSPMTVRSNLQIARYSIAAGLRTPFLMLSSSERIAGALFVDAGVSSMSAQRTVMSCVNCRYENVDLPGGYFGRVGVELGLPGAWRHSGGGVSVAYQRYFGDTGISQEVQIGLTLWIP